MEVNEKYYITDGHRKLLNYIVEEIGRDTRPQLSINGRPIGYHYNISGWYNDLAKRVLKRGYYEDGDRVDLNELRQDFYR
jgi:hypothetical protein